jgi:hypothetical protein
MTSAERWRAQLRETPAKESTMEAAALRGSDWMFRPMPSANCISFERIPIAVTMPSPRPLCVNSPAEDAPAIISVRAASASASRSAE